MSFVGRSRIRKSSLLGFAAHRLSQKSLLYHWHRCTGRRTPDDYTADKSANDAVRQNEQMALDSQSGDTSPVSYRCHLCAFRTVRLQLLIYHEKYFHYKSTAVSYGSEVTSTRRHNPETHEFDIDPSPPTDGLNDDEAVRGFPVEERKDTYSVGDVFGEFQPSRPTCTTDRKKYDEDKTTSENCDQSCFSEEHAEDRGTFPENLSELTSPNKSESCSDNMALNDEDAVLFKGPLKAGSYGVGENWTPEADTTSAGTNYHLSQLLQKQIFPLPDPRNAPEHFTGAKCIKKKLFVPVHLQPILPAPIHSVHVTPVRSVVPAQRDSENVKPKRFSCPRCTLSYRRSADLNRHIKQKHQFTTESKIHVAITTTQYVNSSMACPGQQPLNLSAREFQNLHGASPSKSIAEQQAEPLDLSVKKTGSNVSKFMSTNFSRSCENEKAAKGKGKYARGCRRQNLTGSLHSTNTAGVLIRNVQPNSSYSSAQGDNFMSISNPQCLQTQSGTARVMPWSSPRGHGQRDVLPAVGTTFNRLDKPGHMPHAPADERFSKAKKNPTKRSTTSNRADTSLVDCGSWRWGQCPLCTYVCPEPSEMRSHLEIHCQPPTMTGHSGQQYSNSQESFRSNRFTDEYSFRKSLSGIGQQPESAAIHTPNPSLYSNCITGTGNSTVPAALVPANQMRPFLPMFGAQVAYQQQSASLLFGTGVQWGGYINPRYISPSGKCDTLHPYKCSICGLRSSWRWDLEKHVRSAHPAAKIIRLSKTEDTASTFQATLPSPCLPAVPLFQAMPLSSAPFLHFPAYQQSAAGGNFSGMHSCAALVEPISYTQSSECRFVNDTANINDTKILCRPTASPVTVAVSAVASTRDKLLPTFVATANGDSLRVESTESGTHFPLWSIPDSYTIDKLRLKRFCCTACPYRSNFRSDVVRHIRHKHHNDSTVQIGILNAKHAADSFDNYMSTWARKKFVPTVRLSRRKRFRSLQISPSHVEKVVCEEGASTALNEADGIPYQVLDCDVESDFGIAADRVLGKTDLPFQLGERLTGLMEGCMDDDIIGNVESASEMLKETVPELRDNCCQVDSTVLPKSLELLNRDASAEDHSDVLTSTGVDNRLIVYRCQQCPFVSCKQTEFYYHCQYHQTHTVAAFKCKLCSFGAPTKALLAEHAKVHTGSEVQQFQEQNMEPVSNSMEGSRSPPTQSATVVTGTNEDDHVSVNDDTGSVTGLSSACGTNAEMEKYPDLTADQSGFDVSLSSNSTSTSLGNEAYVLNTANDDLNSQMLYEQERTQCPVQSSDQVLQHSMQYKCHICDHTVTSHCEWRQHLTWHFRSSALWSNVAFQLTSQSHIYAPESTVVDKIPAVSTHVRDYDNWTDSVSSSRPNLDRVVQAPSSEYDRIEVPQQQQKQDSSDSSQSSVTSVNKLLNFVLPIGKSPLLSLFADTNPSVVTSTGSYGADINTCSLPCLSLIQDFDADSRARSSNNCSPLGSAVGVHHFSYSLDTP